jgi:hypothetical protein
LYLKSPVRTDWRYSPGNLLRITRSHPVWRDLEDYDHAGAKNTTQRLEVGETVVFLQAYGFEYAGGNWKRGMWNLKVLSPRLGFVWVCDEYTEGIA